MGIKALILKCYNFTLFLCLLYYFPKHYSLSLWSYITNLSNDLELAWPGGCEAWVVSRYVPGYVEILKV